MMPSRRSGLLEPVPDRTFTCGPDFRADVEPPGQPRKRLAVPAATKLLRSSEKKDRPFYPAGP